MILCITLGLLGIHRYAMGYRNWIWMAITMGGFFVWWIVDLVRIIKGSLCMPDGSKLLLQ